MIALMHTTDLVKLYAVQALLRERGVAAEVFDAAAGAIWRSIIPVRLMVADADLPSARRALTEAGFRQAADGDWDL